MKPYRFLFRAALAAFLGMAFTGAPLFAGGRQGEAPSGSTDVTLSYWMILDGNVSANYNTMAETPYGKALMAKTGITIDYMHPPAGVAAEQFNLIVASGDFPDIMEYGWLGFPGGPEKAVDDGIIIRHNEAMEKYAPHFTAYFGSHPDADRMIKTDSGMYYGFPFFRGDDKLLTSAGLMIRQDWLDELGLLMPETIDEWYTTLKAFKEKKKAPYPLAFEYAYLDWINFYYAYGGTRNFYLADDNRIHYGAVERGWFDFLTTFAKWYKEELIDPDMATAQFDQISAKVTSDQAGATAGSLGSRMGTWTNSARAANPKFSLAGAPVPSLEKGRKAAFRINLQPPFGGTYAVAAITTACTSVETAARLLDWGYSPEGAMLNNFGIEGESYAMVNGYPQYTNAVMNNPKGWSVAQSLSAYIRAVAEGPFIQDERYFEQYMSLPEQQNALTVWEGWEGRKHLVPPVTPTSEESREFARIVNEITTYRDEMTIKFIIGTESLAGWDAYVNTIKRMGIDRALEIQNTALARYNARR